MTRWEKFFLSFMVWCAALYVVSSLREGETGTIMAVVGVILNAASFIFVEGRKS